MDPQRVVKVSFYAAGILLIFLALFKFLYEIIFNLPVQVKAILLLAFTLVVYAFGLWLAERDV